MGLTPEEKKAIAGKMGWNTESYWWCEKCQSAKSPYQVTFYERCTTCMSPVVWKEEHDFSLNDAGLVVAELVRQGKWTKFDQFAYIFSKVVYEADFDAWLFTTENGEATNFFHALSEWIEEEGK